jgi:hypothetical protein
MADKEETDAPEVESEEVEAPEADTEPDETEEPEGGFDRDKTLAKIRKLNSEARNLREQKKQAEAKAAEAGEKAERTVTLEAINARYETLAEHELPLKLAKFITATEPDAILEQAEELLSLGSGGKKPPTQQPREKLRGGGDPTQSIEDQDIAKLVAGVFSN